MAYLMSSWRGDVNLLDLNKPEYRPNTGTDRRIAASTQASNPVIDHAIEALARIGARRAR